MPAQKNLPLPGSERKAMPGAREVGSCDANQSVDVTVRLRPRAAMAHFRTAQAMSREQFAESHGADPNDIARVEEFARTHGLLVKESSAPRRTVMLSGAAGAMQRAFQVELKEYAHPSGNFRGRTGSIYLPEELQGVVQGVFGLDNRPQAKPHFRRPGAKAATQTFDPPQIAKLYNYPTNVDGTGQCVAIIELGGGFKPADLDAYWKQLNLGKTPAVSAVSVGSGRNSPTGDPNGPDAEVMLDIEVIGAIAPGARIVVYFAENTDAGFLNAITTAAHDTKNKPSVISISWGGPESSWTGQAMTSMDDAFQSAGAMGITVCVACGDNGATDGVTDGQNHVDFPASSPNALACGGTRLSSTGNAISSEVVWNDLSANEGATGGGVSDQFALPAWQNNAGVPASANANHRVGRGVPDVAGDADPSTGFNILVDSQTGAIGGTSAVAPLWAALVALLNQGRSKPVGFLNPLLYQNAADFRDITSGNNGAYAAKSGWDACTGLGSPDGAKLAASLKG